MSFRLFLVIVAIILVGYVTVNTFGTADAPGLILVLLGAGLFNFFLWKWVGNSFRARAYVQEHYKPETETLPLYSPTSKIKESKKLEQPNNTQDLKKILELGTWKTLSSEEKETVANIVFNNMSYTFNQTSDYTNWANSQEQSPAEIENAKNISWAVYNKINGVYEIQRGLINQFGSYDNALAYLATQPDYPEYKFYLENREAIDSEFNRLSEIYRKG